MIPVLYDAGERDFTSNGLGRLYDAISCTVTEERNGSFELEMTYPVSGIHYKDILKERIIFAVPADGKKEQPFRIYKISKPMKGITTISARHVSYQLSFVPVKADLTPATTAAQAFERLKHDAIEPWTIRRLEITRHRFRHRFGQDLEVWKAPSSTTLAANMSGTGGR